MRISVLSLGIMLAFPFAFFSSPQPRGALVTTALAASIPSATITNANSATTFAPAHRKAQVKRLAQGTNAFMGELTLAPNAKVPLHRDKTEEYLYFLSGGGRMTIDGKEHTITAGDVIFMPAGAEVSFQNGNVLSRVIQVFAGPSPASKYDTWPRIP